MQQQIVTLGLEQENFTWFVDGEDLLGAAVRAAECTEQVAPGCETHGQGKHDEALVGFRRPSNHYHRALLEQALGDDAGFGVAFVIVKLGK